MGAGEVVCTLAQRALSARPFEIIIATSNGVVSNETPSLTEPSGSVMVMGSLGSSPASAMRRALISSKRPLRVARNGGFWAREGLYGG